MKILQRVTNPTLRVAKASAVCIAAFTSASCTSTGLVDPSTLAGSITVRTNNAAVTIGGGGSGRIGGVLVGSQKRGTLVNCFERHERYRTRTICPDANGRPQTVATYQDPQRTMTEYRNLNGRHHR